MSSNTLLYSPYFDEIRASRSRRAFGDKEPVLEMLLPTYSRQLEHLLVLQNNARSLNPRSAWSAFVGAVGCVDVLFSEGPKLHPVLTKFVLEYVHRILVISPNLERVHSHQLDVLNVLFATRSPMTVDQGRVFRRAQLVGQGLPVRYQDPVWASWFLPLHPDFTMFGVDEVLRPIERGIPYHTVGGVSPGILGFCAGSSLDRCRPKALPMKSLVAL